MIYLDNAATSRYVPAEVMRAFVAAVNRKANAGRGAHKDSAWLGLQMYRVREQIKDLIDNPHAEVVFTKNCTEALNLALRSVRQGHVVSSVTEHNSVLRPLHEMARQGHITLDLVSPADKRAGIASEDVQRALRPHTVMVVLNHISNVTGKVNDVAGVGELCAEKGITFVVDCAQSLGHIPVSMRRIGCDMLAAAGHKGLHGLQGSGFLAFNKTAHVKPLLYGGTGTDSINVYQPIGSPEGLEAGTQNGAAICALGAGIAWTQAHLGKIARRETEYIDLLAARLADMERLTVFKGGSGILSFGKKGLSSTYVADKLNEAGIAVRAGLHCAPLLHRWLGTQQEGLVRLSVGYNNQLREVDKVADAIAYCLQQRFLS